MPDRRLSLVAFAPLAAALIAGCSGSAPVTPPSAPVVAPQGPAYTAYAFDAGGLVRQDFRTGTRTPLLPGVTYLGPRALSPDGSRLAVAYTAGDSARLAILDLARGTVRAVHAVAGRRIVYSPVWSPDGQALAFGFYAARRSPEGGEEMGPGGIRIATAAGIRDVGCQAARGVEAWLPDGTLVVRDQRQWDRRTYYVVTAEGCTDRARIDARKMHHVAFSPDGRWMAYILRELKIRDRKPTADSTLYVADAQGHDPRLVADANAHARHLAWSPDGTRLAFDRQTDAGVRQVYVYDVTSGKPAILNPGTRADEFHFSWSPSGAHFAFDRRLDAGRYQTVVRLFGGTYVVAAEAADAEALPPLLDWLDDERLVLGNPVRVFNAATQQTDTLTVGGRLLHLQAR